jgi:hypothetical protein
MLNRKKYPYLIECLCAILMILPQGNIANVLKNRLEVSKIIVDCSQQNQNNRVKDEKDVEDG